MSLALGTPRFTIEFSPMGTVGFIRLGKRVLVERRARHRARRCLSSRSESEKKASDSFVISLTPNYVLCILYTWRGNKPKPGRKRKEK